MHQAGDKDRSQLCFLLDERLRRTCHTAKLGMGLQGEGPASSPVWGCGGLGGQTETTFSDWKWLEDSSSPKGTRNLMALPPFSYRGRITSHTE